MIITVCGGTIGMKDFPVLEKIDVKDEKEALAEVPRIVRENIGENIRICDTIYTENDGHLWIYWVPMRNAKSEHKIYRAPTMPTFMPEKYKR